MAWATFAMFKGFKVHVGDVVLEAKLVEEGVLVVAADEVYFPVVQTSHGDRVMRSVEELSCCTFVSYRRPGLVYSLYCQIR